MKDIKKENLIAEPIGDYGVEYTYADYMKFEFEEMVELIRGKIFRMSPAPREICQWLYLHKKQHFWLWTSDLYTFLSTKYGYTS